jgi:biopolymer transport protein ExbB/TolQ
MLEWVEKMEQALRENTKKINEQTLEAFYDIRSQLTSRINAHDQAFLQRTHQLTEVEGKWEEKGEQQLSRTKAKLDQTVEQLQKQIKQ